VTALALDKGRRGAVPIERDAGMIAGMADLPRRPTVS
jgi:hypothetical protein